MAREQLKSLTEPMYYILLSLLKENHGYGIMQMVDEVTDGRVAIGAGTLYSLLSRFEKEDIITQVAEENRRKIYRITDKGGELLQDEYTRLNLLVEDGKKFFDSDLERKDPPDNGGGHKEEQKIKVTTTEIAKDIKEESGEQKEKRKAPRGGWSYGGAY